MPDSELSTLDNMRLLAARRAGINVLARIHKYNELLPEKLDKSSNRTIRFERRTWGEAIEFRILSQTSFKFESNENYGLLDEPRILRSCFKLEKN